MTWAVEHPNHRRWSRHSASTTRSGVRVAVRPVGAAEVGLLAALVGAWGAISVFVGPLFGYRPTSANAWTWTTQNWFLHLLPGAVAVVAGLMILSASPSRRRAGTGGPTGLAALLIVAAGAWFVIGPALWATFESGQPFATGTSSWTSFLNQVGSSLGPGLLLAMLGGMALKAVIARPAATVDELPAEGASMAATAPATEHRMAREDRLAADDRLAGESRTAGDETTRLQPATGPTENRMVADRGRGVELRRRARGLDAGRVSAGHRMAAPDRWPPRAGEIGLIRGSA